MGRQRESWRTMRKKRCNIEPITQDHLLVENRFGLPSVTLLLVVVTTLSLGEKRALSRLVLGHLVHGVVPTPLARAESASFLRNVHLVVATQPKSRVTVETVFMN